MRARTLRYLERLPLLARRPFGAIALTLLVTIAALALRLAIEPLIGGGYPFITFFPTVILCGLLFGARCGIIATLACALLAWFVLVGPLTGFVFGRGPVTAVALFAIISASEIVLIHCLQLLIAQLAAERETNRALAETRSLLFSELQHRVSNNLQVAASLLTLQKRDVADAAARAALDEASERLALIGRISRQLYDPQGAMISMARFLETLCGDVVAASGRDGLQCVVDADDSIELAPEAAIPVALISTEAVNNAIEHGFAGRAGGKIEVELKRESRDSIRLTISDDGHGIAEGYAIEQSDSLGLRIATMLARQLGGQLRLERANGTRAILSMQG